MLKHLTIRHKTLHRQTLPAPQYGSGRRFEPKALATLVGR